MAAAVAYMLRTSLDYSCAGHTCCQASWRTQCPSHAVRLSRQPKAEAVPFNDSHYFLEFRACRMATSSSQLITTLLGTKHNANQASIIPLPKMLGCANEQSRLLLAIKTCQNILIRRPLYYSFALKRLLASILNIFLQQKYYLLIPMHCVLVSLNKTASSSARKFLTQYFYNF